MKTILMTIKELTKSIGYKTQLIGRNQRLTSGLEKTRIKGIIIGFILTIFILGLPIVYYKGGL